MLIAVDTGILLRLVDRNDPQHATIRASIRIARQRGDILLTTSQNIAEFWNVCTRPSTARGGFGLSIEETHGRLRLIERLIPVLPDSAASYPIWKQLIVAHAVMGVQVHDARLVALLQVHGVTHILTLNPGDFQRYPGVTALTPTDLVSTASPPRITPP